MYEEINLDFFIFLKIHCPFFVVAIIYVGLIEYRDHDKVFLSNPMDLDSDNNLHVKFIYDANTSKLDIISGNSKF